MEFLVGVQKLFLYYKSLVDSTLSQLNEEQLFWQYNAESNSIAVLIQHLSGNMKSRFSDFLTTDGEKEWRNRDAEFELRVRDKALLHQEWEAAWKVLFDTLTQLTEDDLSKVVYIRNEGETVINAINRQLAHYPYHVGQIVQLGKMMKGERWHPLSIPKGGSKQYNESKFMQEKRIVPFTDEILRHLDS